MAALLQDHAGGKRLIAPVAAHKGVRLMPVAHLFNSLDAHRLADGAVLQQFLDSLVKHGIAQHVAYRHLPPQLQRQIGQFPALLRRRGNRLFQQQIVSPEQRGLRLTVVARMSRHALSDIMMVVIYSCQKE